MRMIKVDSNYVIHDLKEGFVHERPSLKTIRDYDDAINSIKDFKTIWDYLQLFNATGIVAMTERHYKDFENRPYYDYRVVYNMFGTYIYANNADYYPDKTDTGVYILGSASSWSRDYDVLGIDDNIYSKEDKDEHIRSFYDLSGVLYEFLEDESAEEETKE